MLFTLKNALVAMVVMAGAVRASPIDEPSTTEATSIVPTSIIDIDISEGFDVGEISVRSGCSQGVCPDNKAAFDFMKRFWQDYSSEHNLAWYTYNIRVNDCGQCVSKKSSSDGCADFTSCGRKQNICVDTSKRRAHRIWKDKNAKECYSLRYDQIGSCGLAKGSDFHWPYKKIKCTW
ncbi:hypothetical protein VE03_04703 [Pseudogymnoascus sp. 23342-1-I1]|nr:hypothetical protein VE03_04703 [Pseudogymnoascus sp. 23342-1-I1]